MIYIFKRIALLPTTENKNLKFGSSVLRSLTFSISIAVI